MKISRRQKDILDRISLGMSDKQIALDMGRSYGTVKTHALAAFKALGVHNRTQAAVRWINERQG